MKVWIVEDEYDYFLTQNEWASCPSVEITEEEWADYQHVEDERERWQSNIQDMVHGREKKKWQDANPYLLAKKESEV